MRGFYGRTVVRGGAGFVLGGVAIPATREEDYGDVSNRKSHLSMTRVTQKKKKGGCSDGKQLYTVWARSIARARER